MVVPLHVDQRAADPQQGGPDDEDADRWPVDPDAAFDHLIREFGDWVLRMAVLHVTNRALAEDLTQEVFLRAYRGWRALRSHGRPQVRAWLAQITVNLCRDHWRKERGRRTPPPWQHPDEKLDALPSTDAAGDPEWALVLAEQFAELRAALLTLSPPERRALLLYYYFDLDTPAMARLDDCSEATIRSRLLRARTRLRKAMEQPDLGR
jgi:RNA polymerase sigma-70 factor (ECF subfamily)